MKDIVSKTRSSFFEEFGGIEACTDHFGVCRRPTEAMKRFASACYLQAYDHTVTTKKKLISFPWVTCWDVINTIHQENSCRPDPQGLFHFRMFDPFGLSISEYIDKYIKHQMAVFDKFKNFLLSTSEHISLYVYKYPGLHVA
jgi:hypothetical protein